MCGGPSGAEQRIAKQQQEMSTQYMDEATKYFSKQMGVIDTIQASVQPILKAGVNQQGFSPAEKSALDANAINTTAGNYRNAAVVSGENAGAAQGNTYAPTGGEKELDASIATAGAQQTSSEENQIEQADYTTGRSNYWAAESALGNEAGLLGSGATSMAGTSVNAGEAAFKSADTVQQEKNQATASMIGMGMSLATMGMSGIGNMDFSGGSSVGENIGNFASGALG